MFSISLQDPAGIFELIEVVGNGTYGQVYKVSHECRLSRRRTTLRVFCRKTNHVICGGWCYQYFKFMCIIRLVSLAWVGTMYVNVYKKYIFVIVRHLIAGEFVLSQIFLWRLFWNSLKFISGGKCHCIVSPRGPWDQVFPIEIALACATSWHFNLNFWNNIEN